MTTFSHPIRRRMLAAALSPFTRAPIDADALLDRATRAEGTTQLPDGVLPGLEQLCAALETEGQLNGTGRMLAQQQLLRLLRNALRCAAEPESVVSLGHPIVIVGLHRSGTTRLHHLLSLDPRARFLPAWRTMQASPAESSKGLVRQGAMDIRAWRWMAPEADARHRHSASDPEEEGVLLGTTFRTAQLYETFPVPSYLRWALGGDLSGTYAFLRERLRAFQPHLPGEHWVLKYPGHLHSLELLAATFPGARIVHTHRDPVRAVCSYIGLIAATHAVMTPDPLRPALVEATFWRCEEAISRSIAARSSPELADILDVAFSDLVAHPIETVRAIYTTFDIEWNDEHELRMRSFLQKSHVAGPVELPERFGLNAGEVRSRLEPYLDTYAEWLQ